MSALKTFENKSDILKKDKSIKMLNHFKQFLLSPQCFQYLSAAKASKCLQYKRETELTKNASSIVEFVSNET